MIRRLLIAPAIAVAAISAGTTVSGGFVTPPLTFTASCLPGDLPLSIHCDPPARRSDTYQCVDGCYSNSQTPQGACSHHGGIDHPVNQGTGQ